MSKPIFSIITPCRNSETLIGETIESVLGQKVVRNGTVELEYFICDGASTDRTVEIATTFKDSRIKIISEPDHGPYHALAKCLFKTSGNICAYINAGDLYSPHAFEIVAELFQSRGIKWLTGFEVAYNENSQLIQCKLPFLFRRRLIECGMYGRYLPFIQQESTFWDSSLNRLLDGDTLASFRLAGDFYLWKMFAQEAQLYVIAAHLGGFRFHRGQLSEDRRQYLDEMTSIADQAGLADYLLTTLDWPMWLMPTTAKKMINRSSLLLYDPKTRKWV